MVMASIDVKIRHVFGDTPITEASIGAAPPGNSIAQWYGHMEAFISSINMVWSISYTKLSILLEINGA